MADLERLRTNFPKDARTAFEDLCTHLFCTKLGLREAVSRRKNQWGIESDPVEVEGKVYAFQAKFYDAGTSLGDSKHKDDLVKSVTAAGEAGATDLIIFVNKDLTQNRTHEKPEYEKAVDAEAAKQGVEVHWWDKSRIQGTLDMPDYQHIRRICIDNTSEAGLHDFYDYVYRQFAEDSGDELFGSMTLSESYIEPSVCYSDENGHEGSQTVREYIESWVGSCDAGSSFPIAVICGEPGHGKTALCKKAMCDFYKHGWLAGKVSNVFRFSLNQAYTEALANDQFNFYKLLSWGGDRTSKSHSVDEKDCKGELVFLDGFDELLEWYPMFDLERFIRQYVVRFQQDTKSHVIITSRSIVVDHGRDERKRSEYTVNGRKRVPILRLESITKAQQIEWINTYREHCRRDSSFEGSEESADLERFADGFERMSKSDDLQRILSIPIIFRMVVVAKYQPEGDQSITQMYDDLFEATWARHNDHKAGMSEEDAKASLARHALRVFCGNNDTAPVENGLESPWLFSFYTTHGGSRCVGFLHRSFYQYFLAYEVLSCLRDYANESDANRLSEKLAYLGFRRLDETTLGYIRDLHANAEDTECLDTSFDAVCRVIQETDGILALPSDGIGTEEVEKATPLARAHNVFWNAMSICSMCGHLVSVDKVNALALRTYDLEGCHLEEADLTGARLDWAHLRWAHLRWANLRWADLTEARLTGARLTGADLTGADLLGADLTDALLDGETRRQLEQALAEQAAEGQEE